MDQMQQFLDEVARAESQIDQLVQIMNEKPTFEFYKGSGFIDDEGLFASDGPRGRGPISLSFMFHGHSGYLWIHEPRTRNQCFTLVIDSLGVNIQRAVTADAVNRAFQERMNQLTLGDVYSDVSLQTTHAVRNTIIENTNNDGARSRLN